MGRIPSDDDFFALKRINDRSQVYCNGVHLLILIKVDTHKRKVYCFPFLMHIASGVLNNAHNVIGALFNAECAAQSEIGGGRFFLWLYYEEESVTKITAKISEKTSDIRVTSLVTKPRYIWPTPGIKLKIKVIILLFFY